MSKKIIDVSEHQGKINWSKVKPYIDGAIIRTGYGDDIKTQDDKYAAYNMEQCEKLGIPYGTYLYSYASNSAHIESELKHEERVTKGHPVITHWLDLEEWNLRKLNKEISTKWIDKFDSAGVYAGQAYWKDPLKDFECRRWIPAYGTNDGTEQKKYEPQFIKEGWQYTSRGHFPGISGNVDVSRWDVPFTDKIANELKQPENKLEGISTSTQVYKVKKKEVAALIMKHLCTHIDHGYTQKMEGADGRWGDSSHMEEVDVYGKIYKIPSGDRDCSSAVISAFKAAGIDCGNATYTGNMRSEMTKTGNFEWKPMSYIAHMGDVYLNEKNHTAMCLSAEPDVLMEFSINEKGGTLGGKVGDQKQVGDYDETYGRGESHLKKYYDYPWNGILKCVNDEVAFEIEYLVEADNGLATVVGETIVELKNELPEIKGVTPEVVADVFRNKYGRGSGEGSERFNNLMKAGYDPVEVQSKVNWVYAVASGIKAGTKAAKSTYGNGSKRRQVLGDWYDVVQKEINVLSGIEKW